jgi:hypothetical protein
MDDDLSRQFAIGGWSHQSPPSRESAMRSNSQEAALTAAEQHDCDILALIAIIRSSSLVRCRIRQTSTLRRACQRAEVQAKLACRVRL